MSTWNVVQVVPGSDEHVPWSHEIEGYYERFGRWPKQVMWTNEDGDDIVSRFDLTMYRAGERLAALEGE